MLDSGQATLRNESEDGEETAEQRAGDDVGVMVMVINEPGASNECGNSKRGADEENG